MYRHHEIFSQCEEQLLFSNYVKKNKTKTKMEIHVCFYQWQHMLCLFLHQLNYFSLNCTFVFTCRRDVKGFDRNNIIDHFQEIFMISVVGNGLCMFQEYRCYIMIYISFIREIKMCFPLYISYYSFLVVFRIVTYEYVAVLE